MAEFVSDIKIKNTGAIGINGSIDINDVSVNSLMYRYWVVTVQNNQLYLTMYSDNKEYLEREITKQNVGTMFIIDTEWEDGGEDYDQI